MNTSKTAKIIVAIIAALLLIVAFVLFFKQSGEENKEQGSSAPVIVAGYDISGTWYSDRERGDTLTLNSSGSYTSLNWLANGNYTASDDNRTITLTDSFGDRKQLTLVMIGDAYVMKYEGAAAHTYYRTTQEVTAAQEAQQAAAEEIKSFYDAALLQILTTGEWVSLDETTTLNFTDSTFTVEFAGNQFIEATVYEHSYIVTSFEVINGNYSIKMDIHDNTSGLDFNNSSAGISIKEDNTYVITCGNFPYAQKYQKTVEIEFAPISSNDD